MMRRKLVFAYFDQAYAQILSDVLHNKKEFEILEIRSLESFSALQGEIATADVLLLEEGYCQDTAVPPNGLVLSEELHKELQDPSTYVYKYKRISNILANLYEKCAQSQGGYGIHNGAVTAFWSPAGGTGKTTCALAYATKRALAGKSVIYLNLEHFSSSPVHFVQEGKSISSALSKMQHTENLHMLLRSIWRQDSQTGIHYFTLPDSYADYNELTLQEIKALIEACATDIDEVVVDLSSVFNEKIECVLSIVSDVYLVHGNSESSAAKLSQFFTQHSVWQIIKHKTTVICNRGGQLNCDAPCISLPMVQGNCETTIFKTLSGANF